MATSSQELESQDSETLLPAHDAAEQSPPWELLESGRYMPRRIRGSCRGRELG